MTPLHSVSDLLDDTLTDGEECPKVAKELAKEYKPKKKGNKREKRGMKTHHAINLYHRLNSRLQQDLK